MTTLNMQERVANGIRILERYYEDTNTQINWWEPLEVDSIDLSNTTECIIGQSFDEFNVDNLSKLTGYPHHKDGSPMSMSSVCGLAYCDHNGFNLIDHINGGYERLAIAWTQAIERHKPQHEVGDRFMGATSGQIRMLIGVVRSGGYWYGVMEIPEQKPQNKSFAELDDINVWHKQP